MAPAEGKAEILVPAVVGIPGIDSQHEALYGYLNDFIQLNLEKAPERQKVRESFDRLVHYTLSHFDDEEFFMRSIHYPDFERHAELHRNLREAVDEYSGRFETETNLCRFTGEIVEFLKYWLKHHIFIEDTRIARFYRGERPDAD